MSKKRETIGKIATDLQKKALDNTHSAEEQMREQLTDYETNVVEAIERGKKDYIGNFYVVVLTKKERLLHNVLRNYFFVRFTCPTPEFDQIVYRFNKAEEGLEFMWVIPSKDTCELMKLNAVYIDKSEWDLLNFVLKFYDGSLLKIAKKLNNEQLESPLLLN